MFLYFILRLVLNMWGFQAMLVSLRLLSSLFPLSKNMNISFIRDKCVLSEFSHWCVSCNGLITHSSDCVFYSKSLFRCISLCMYSKVIFI